MAESSIRQSKKNNHDNSDARTHTTVSSDTAVASEGGAYSAELLKGGDFSEAAFERHVSHLSDSRLSQPAYVQRRALIIRQIQRDYGNQYVQRLVNRIQTQRAQGIQTRLTVGPAGDEYEREADRVAKQVVGMSQPVQRQGPEEEEEELQAKVLQRQDEEEELQMKPILRQMGMEGGDAEPDIEQSIQHARGSGEPIPDDVRSSMEGAFGADFSGVKVHTGSESDAPNNSLSASAFTTGQDIFVRRQDYNPGSRKGQELLAHELTLVVQQNDVTVQRDDNRHEASHGNRYAQRRLQYHMNDSLDFLTENYPKQAGEIKAFAYSKYGFQWLCT